VFAGKENCPDNVIHCAYLSGFPSTNHSGKFIKIQHTDPKRSLEKIVCFDDKSIVLLSTAVGGLGIYQDTYSICSNIDGRKCEQVGVDVFTVSSNGDEDVASPQYYNINLSNVKNDYPNCDSLTRQQKI
jgi:hypothetical protein